MKHTAVMLLDPTDHFKKLAVTDNQIIAACGLVPGFLMNGDPDLTQWDRAEQGYGFGTMNEISGATVNILGVFEYPDDPPLHPLCTIIEGNEFFFMYRNGITAFIVMNENGDRTSVKITRMD